MERFKVVLSTGTQNDTTGFSKILYSATLQNGNWNEITVNLTAYANKEIYLAFVHYKCTNNFYLRLDDIRVISEQDIQSPTVIDNSLSIYPAEQNAKINMTVTDFSLIQSAVLSYKVGSGSTVNLPMTAAGDKYSAIIPGQSNDVTASYQVVVKDVANNTTTTDWKQINWANQLWFDWGANYTNYGQGFLTSSWKAAVDFDFGTQVYKIRRFESSMMNAETNCMWKVTGFDSIPLTNQIGDLAGYTNFPGNYATNTIYVASHTPVTSKFAVVISSNGNRILMDPQGSDSHTFIKEGNNSFKLLTSLPGASSYHGSWHIRVYAVFFDNAIEEHEFIPGEIKLTNYPNPFNPTTTIKFFNNCSGNVNLTVYNYKGEKVKELMNSRMSTGEHSVAFDGTNLSSGVYFYRLTTPVKAATGRMLLVK